MFMKNPYSFLVPLERSAVESPAMAGVHTVCGACQGNGSGAIFYPFWVFIKKLIQKVFF
jgi:hypothetical protein